MMNMFPDMKIIIILTIFFYYFALLQTMTEKKVETKATNGRPTWKAKTTGYEHCVFYVGKKCGEDFIQTNRELSDYIKVKYGHNALRSMLLNTITIKGMSKPYNYPSKEEMERALSYTEQLAYADEVKAYHKLARAVKYSLGEIAALLWSHCDLSMRNKLGSNPEYQKMDDDDGGTLYRLISKILNGSAAVQNPIRQASESLFTFMYVRGGDYELQQYYEAFENRRSNAEKLGIFFESDVLRDLVLAEYTDQKDTANNLYIVLFEWKKVSNKRPTNMDDDDWNLRALKIATGKAALNEKMNAMLFLRRSGEKYDAYRQELYNMYLNGQDNFPLTVQDALTCLDAWKPAYINTKKTSSSFVQEGDPTTKQKKKDKDKTRTVPGDQHYGGGDTGGNRQENPCFRCDQLGCTFWKCKETKKENGRPVETDEVAKQKYNDAKKSWDAAAAAKRDAVKKGSDAVGTEETAGQQHFIGGEVVPTFDKMISGDDSDDDDITRAYGFTSQGVIEIDVCSTNHAFNQATSSLGRYDVLNDNQSTSNIIVEKERSFN